MLLLPRPWSNAKDDDDHGDDDVDDDHSDAVHHDVFLFFFCVALVVVFIPHLRIKTKWKPAKEINKVRKKHKKKR